MARSTPARSRRFLLRMAAALVLGAAYWGAFLSVAPAVQGGKLSQLFWAPFMGAWGAGSIARGNWHTPNLLAVLVVFFLEMLLLATLLDLLFGAVRRAASRSN